MPSGRGEALLAGSAGDTGVGVRTAGSLLDYWNGISAGCFPHPSATARCSLGDAGHVACPL